MKRPERRLALCVICSCAVPQYNTVGKRKGLGYQRAGDDDDDTILRRSIANGNDNWRLDFYGVESARLTFIAVCYVT